MRPDDLRRWPDQPPPGAHPLDTGARRVTRPRSARDTRSAPPPQRPVSAGARRAPRYRAPPGSRPVSAGGGRRGVRTVTYADLEPQWAQQQQLMQQQQQLLEQLQQYQQQQNQPHVPPPLASQHVYEYHSGAAQRTAPGLAAHAQHAQPQRQPPLQPKRGVPPPPSMPPHTEAPTRLAAGGAWQGGPDDHEIVEIVDVHAGTHPGAPRPGSARHTPSSARAQESPGRQASPGPMTATQAIQEVDYLVDLLRPTNERHDAEEAAEEAAAEEEAEEEAAAAAARDYVQQVRSRAHATDAPAARTPCFACRAHTAAYARRACRARTLRTLTIRCHARRRQGRAYARMAARDAARCRGNGSRPSSASSPTRRERASPPPRLAASRPTSARSEGPWAQPVMAGVRDACSPSRADELQPSAAPGLGRPTSAPPMGRGAEAGRRVYRPKQPAAGALRPTSASNRYIE